MHDMASDTLDHLPHELREKLGPSTGLAIGHALAVNGLEVVAYLLATPDAAREDLPSETWLVSDIALYAVRTYRREDDFRFQTEAYGWADVHGAELTYDASLSRDRPLDFEWGFKLQSPRIEVRQFSLDMGLPDFAREVMRRALNP